MNISTNSCPNWTVCSVIFSPEKTDWHGTSWEFFDDPAEAGQCLVRHEAAGNEVIVVPFHAGHIAHLGKPGLPAIGPIGTRGCPVGEKGERGEPGVP